MKKSIIFILTFSLAQAVYLWQETSQGNLFEIDQHTIDEIVEKSKNKLENGSSDEKGLKEAIGNYTVTHHGINEKSGHKGIMFLNGHPYRFADLYFGMVFKSPKNCTTVRKATKVKSTWVWWYGPWDPKYLSGRLEIQSGCKDKNKEKEKQEEMTNRELVVAKEQQPKLASNPKSGIIQFVFSIAKCLSFIQNTKPINFGNIAKSLARKKVETESQNIPRIE